MPLHDNNITIPLAHDDNKIVTQSSACENDVVNKSPSNENNSFLLDLENLDDKEVNIAAGEDEDANKNAMDFLKKWG